MLTDKDLRELLSYQAQSPVLSVYLKTDPMEGSADVHKLRLRAMLKEVDLEDDVEAVMRYIEHEHNWSGRSLVMFSCQPEDYWRSYSLSVPVRSRIRISDRPYVKPLADVLDSYGGYGVALVDKQGARFFYFHLGEVREQVGVLGEEVRKTKRGGGSQAAGRRGGTAGQTNYVNELAERNVKDAAEAAIRFFSENNIRRILIGGTEDNIAMFRSQLPKAYQSLVVGTFPMSMTASEVEVLERALQVGLQAERRREAQLVDAVVTSAAKGRGGVIDLDSTLNAVREGRVQTLLIRDGFRASGCRCTSCGYISSSFSDSCPFCGGECEQIQDAVEHAVRQVMQNGGEVEVLRGEDNFHGFDQIGALLRY